MFEIYCPLIDLIDSKLSEIKAEFNSTRIEMLYDTERIGEYEEDMIIITEGLYKIERLGFELTLSRFEKGGKKAFDACHKFEIQLDKYKFTIGQESGKVWDDRAY